MAAYATKLSELFASKVQNHYHQHAVAETITNQDYEGQIRDTASVLNILTFGALSLKDYSGADLTVDDITESNAQLVTDQQKAFYFRIKSLDRFKSFIKNPSGTIIEEAASILKEAIDTRVLSHWADAASGHWDGTVYNTGTVEIAASTGVVTGTGTTFTSAMVGKPFKATGHTSWYRVKSRASNTEIVIEDDKDDEASAYTGGAISAGATYEIQANTAVQVTKATLHTRMVQLKTYLDKAKVPTTNRWIVFPADIANLMIQPDAANPYVMALKDGYENAVNGFVGRAAGFDCYSNEQVAGDSTNGFHVLAGHKSAITMAMAFTESGVEDLVGNFGKAYKGLNVYGTKVVDVRRKALAHGFWKL